MPIPKQTSPGTFIAATALSSTPIRVYFQDTFQAIREFRHSSQGWRGGSSSDIVTQGKNRSPLALKEWVESSVRHLRLYSISEHNMLQERCSDREGEWFEGPLTSLGWAAAPFAKLAAATFTNPSLPRIRMYYQLPDHRIQECGNDDSGWQILTTLPPFGNSALPRKGTSIASVGSGSSGGDMLVFVQDDDGFIWVYASSPSWYAAKLDARAKGLSPLTVVTWDDGGQKIRLYFLNEDNYIQEYCRDHDTPWYYSSLGDKRIQTAPYSHLSAIMWDCSIRVYFQPTSKDTIEELGLDPGRDWSQGPLPNITSDSKLVDFEGKTYAVGMLPWLGDLKSWRSYDPAEIDGIGILIGYQDGRLVGENLKEKKSTYLHPNKTTNSYTWVYTPEGSIFYRLWDHDHRNKDDYVRHSQLGSGRPVICAGEFRVSRLNYIDSVIVMMNDASGHYQPKGSQCLGPVAAKLERLGIPTDKIDWYYKS